MFAGNWILKKKYSETFFTCMYYNARNKWPVTETWGPLFSAFFSHQIPDQYVDVIYSKGIYRFIRKYWRICVVFKPLKKDFKDKFGLHSLIWQFLAAPAVLLLFSIKRCETSLPCVMYFSGIIYIMWCTVCLLFEETLYKPNRQPMQQIIIVENAWKLMPLNVAALAKNVNTCCLAWLT